MMKKRTLEELTPMEFSEVQWEIASGSADEYVSRFLNVKLADIKRMREFMYGVKK